MILQDEERLIPPEGLPDELEFHPHRPVKPGEKVKPTDVVISSTGPVVSVRKYGVEPRPIRPRTKRPHQRIK